MFFMVAIFASLVRFLNCAKYSASAIASQPEPDTNLGNFRKKVLQQNDGNKGV
jgi:hypothetical protein